MDSELVKAELDDLPESVRRFDCTNGGAQWCQGCYTMTEDEDGDYVRSEDYDRLSSRVKELERENAALHKAAARGALAQMKVESELAALRDALDHIARVSLSSRNITKRLRWIVARAKSALDGNDSWTVTPTPKGYHDALERGALLDVGKEG